MLQLFLQSVITGVVLTFALLACRRYGLRLRKRAPVPAPDARALRCVHKLDPSDL